MEFVTEELIDKIMDSYDEGELKFLNDSESLINKQLAFSALLTDDELDLLTEDEYDLMWFVATVAYTAFMEANPNTKVVDPVVLEGIEEHNWEVIQNSQEKNFNEKLNQFFDNYKQEELLAFLEDSLESDEDVVITPTGKELIFVTIKSMIDALIAHS